MCNNTHQLVIMITHICTNSSSCYNLTPKSTYACIPPVIHLFLSVVTFYWCQSLNVNFIHFTKNTVTHSQHEVFINLDIIHKIRHLCTLEYNRYCKYNRRLSSVWNIHDNANKEFPWVYVQKFKGRK
jgi:hypothetical protein